jgi:hypothetical protein
MADPILDEVNLVTLPEVYDACIQDWFFLGSPFQAHLRAKCLVPFKGGAFTRDVGLYNPQYGGAYAKGIGGFNLNKPQTLGGMVFDPRYYCVMIIEYLEDIDVLNTGDLSVFSLLETDMANAMQTISTIIALDLQQNGQIGSRTINLNGWVEALNDGQNPSWDGNIYTTYGTATRNGVMRNAINGNVYWGGNSDGSAAAIQYPAVNALYSLAVRGKAEPDLILGNKPIINAVENRIQPQQRFDQSPASVRDPYWGATGFRFKNAIVMRDDYFPSAQTGYASASNGGLGNNLTSTVAYTALATPFNNFPATNVTLTIGEVLCFFNTGNIKFRISNSREFGFNATDFIRDPSSTRVASQLKAAVNVEFPAPWEHVQSYGWLPS